MASQMALKEKWVPWVVDPVILKRHPDLLNLTCASWSIFKQSLVMSMYAKSVVTAQATNVTQNENMLKPLSDIRDDVNHICNNCGDSFFNEYGYESSRLYAALSDFLIFDVRQSIPETPKTMRERSPSGDSDSMYD
jgi:hypothetical protein